MIKLNNKNITYVALADTNNSLKAPKEIWYADSNNSVKLVYKRKDALIEGEDYEKYHWLVGDADAYINTLKNYRPYDDSVQMTFRDNLYPNRESKFNKYHQEEQIWGACETNNLQSILIRSYVSGGSAPNKFCNNIIDGNTADSDVSWGTYATQNYISESPEHSLYISSVNNEDRYYFIYNGKTRNNLPTRYTLPELVQQDVRIFYSGIHDNGYFNGSFFNFIHYRNNVEITHLIPCKLLKPVPKWLDANGIRRQVGECGMIDLVSGKFYGNVNNVGTFTVENYYERKEWLVAQTTEKVTMMALPLRTSDFKYSIRLLDRVPNLSYFTTGWHTYGVLNTQTLVFIYDRKNSTKVYSCQTGFQLGDIIMIDSTAEDLLFNNISIPKYGFPADNFIIQTNNDVALNMIVSSITVDGNERYIPCTLTMDLPASMDANNIARTKGTSGMWDLVSDRFYGNVASSGTFKAVNLAEGVDYEVHQWLVANIPIGVTMMRLFINQSSSVNYTMNITTTSNSIPLFRTAVNGNKEDYVYFNNKSKLDVWSYITGTNESVSVIYSNNGLYNIELSPSEFIINSVSATKYGDAYTIVWHNNPYSTNAGVTSTSKITVDGIERYIPVKLLKAIPSKYDANGIARKAGECGMYDTVNDVFYGNVASSGTFTVEDDN